MSIMSRARGSDKWALKIEQVMQFRMKWLEVPSIDYWSTIIEPSLWYASRSHWFCCCLLLAHWRNCLWRMKWCSWFSLLHGMFTFCLHDSANSCDFENLCTRAASGVDGAAILLNEFTCTLWRCTLRNMPKFVFDFIFHTYVVYLCIMLTCWRLAAVRVLKLQCWI